MTDNPFAPIGSSAARKPAPPAKKTWKIIAPVPADAPTLPAAHPTLGKPSALWTYRDATGAILGHVCRFESPSGKEFRPVALYQPVGGGKAVWRFESWPSPRPLYGLDRLAARPDAPVLITEGEKAADAAGRMLKGYVAITSPNGSKSAGKADWSPLAGRQCVIWPDADEPGQAYADAVAAALTEAGAASISIISPPIGSPEGFDAADAERDGWSSDRALSLTMAALEHGPAPSEDSDDLKEEDKSRRRRPAQRDSLMALTKGCRLWHDPSGAGYVSFNVKDHRESWPIRSRNFTQWLANQAYTVMGLAPGKQALEDTLRVLEARAVTEGPEHEPWTRVGERDGRIFLDLCDSNWSTVEISARGWEVRPIVDEPFVRSSSMRPLPVPEGGEEIKLLRRWVNVADDDAFVLVVGWLLGALRPRGPYSVLVLSGEQGSGKSNFSRLLRSLTDPSQAPIRAAPKEDRDMVVAAGNSHVLAFDNLSRVDLWLSDAMCRMSTGGGFSTRALHTDRDEMIFAGSRPQIINGIPALTGNPDLADRSLQIRLRPISLSERRTEEEFWGEWAGVQPFVLGALLDAASAALRRYATTKLENLPRMADLAKWITAAESGLGWEDGSFLAAYRRNREAVVDNAFEASPVAVAIDRLLSQQADGSGWNGTPTQLLDDLVPWASEAVRRNRAIWPQTAQSLGNMIDRINPILRGRGIQLERRHSGVRNITIVRLQSS